MKKTGIVLVIFLLHSAVFAQEEENKNTAPSARNMYLDFIFGTSLPVGKSYPSVNPDNEKSGYATPGFLVQGNFDWMGKKKLGIVFQATYQNNPINENAEGDTLEGNIFPLGSGNWQNVFIMAGPIYLNRMNKFVIDVKVTGGFVISMGPVFSMTNPETKQKEEKTATGFGLGISGGGSYLATKHLALKLNIGYLAGFPSVTKQYAAYQYWDTNLNRFVFTAPAEISISKTVSAFTLAAGIIIAL